ncbi:hypothetical protein VD0002_g7690 [Verticillium dahliae]|uniref:Uncharacterized protein n=1 Tax=Verticillium dahliae TaxID=27337 RepID=A0A2J8FCV3_VERDA|nr:Putative acetyltransferase C18B11.09c [Verticillium dahliae VDG2]KAF3358359.1 hypothetical protein VdG1_05435 [Verticillium dahliae VDG1]PNH30603.1 hypothetical protein BJF96_g6230 [Verticillium dahliae]PNH48583.1 hypothetical protein VD0003_g8542 [Verticillium dahliae]PNH59892.1 hypothetical protein VD0002_g7690 [Verticillium dahliae]
MKFLEARDKDNKTSTDKWRPVVKGMLTIAEEEEKEEVMTPIKTSMVSETLSRRRLAVPLLWGSLIASVPSPLTSPMFHGSAGDF